MSHKQHKRNILRGEALLAALIATEVAVKWLRVGEPKAQEIPPAMALAIVRAGIFEGKMQGRRIRYIREIDPRPKAEWQACWRTTEASVLTFWQEAA